MIWNRQAEAMAPAARARLQLERLRETLAWAVERVAFHRERLEGATLKTLDDLARLPFVRKTDLREQYPFGLFAVPRPEIAREVVPAIAERLIREEIARLRAEHGLGESA